jgi:hypothetical protein
MRLSSTISVPAVIRVCETGTVILDRDWLAEALRRAAGFAGLEEEWWPAEHIAQSVTTFLEARGSEVPLGMERFCATVRSVLEGLGYGQVASQFLRDGLELRVSLLDFLPSTGVCFEMHFFAVSAERLRTVLAGSSVKRLVLEDLRDCVKGMAGHRHWGPRCGVLMAEVVDHLRAVVRTASSDVVFAIL